MVESLLKPIAIVSLGMFAFTANANAAVVTNYTGTSFDFFADPPFTSLDSISGFAIFDNVGNSIAQSVTLSVTLNEGPGFAITESNVSGFSWTGDTPTGWNLVFSEDVFGGSDAEEFFVAAGIGDLAVIDNAPLSPEASSSSPGEWSSASAVPEPSSMAALALGLIGLSITRLHRKNSFRKQK